jgi:hypothetical protein
LAETLAGFLFDIFGYYVHTSYMLTWIDFIALILPHQTMPVITDPFLIALWNAAHACTGAAHDYLMSLLRALGVV